MVKQHWDDMIRLKGRKIIVTYTREQDQARLKNAVKCQCSGTENFTEIYDHT